MIWSRTSSKRLTRLWMFKIPLISFLRKWRLISSKSYFRRTYKWSIYKEKDQITIEVEVQQTVYSGKKISDNYFPSDLYAKPHYILFFKQFEPKVNEDHLMATEIVTKMVEVRLSLTQDRRVRKLQELLHLSRRLTRRAEADDPSQPNSIQSELRNTHRRHTQTQLPTEVWD